MVTQQWVRQQHAVASPQREDSAHNREMTGPGKQQLHMRMGPLASQAVLRLLEIRYQTSIWTGHDSVCNNGIL
nr:hypothetical protein [Tanacetum cinerariifolium]